MHQLCIATLIALRTKKKNPLWGAYNSLGRFHIETRTH